MSVSSITPSLITWSTLPAAPADRSLAEIATAVVVAYRRGPVAAYDCGRLLRQAKARLPHGEWLTWLAERIGMPVRTAQRYMRAGDVRCASVERLIDLYWSALPSDRRQFVARVAARHEDEMRHYEQDARECRRTVDEEIAFADFCAATNAIAANIGDDAAELVSSMASPLSQAEVIALARQGPAAQRRWLRQWREKTAGSDGVREPRQRAAAQN